MRMRGEMNKAIILKSSSTLQCWGIDCGNTDYKKTNSFPTKSGVIGLLVEGCFGISHEQEEYLSLSKQINNKVKIICLVDKPGSIYLDFQRVSNIKPYKEIRGKQSKRKTLLVSVEYLVDAEFTVAVLVEDQPLFEKILENVKKPKGLLFLGRKNCIPSSHIYFGTKEYNEYEDIFDNNVGEIYSDVEFKARRHTAFFIKDSPKFNGKRDFTNREVFLIGSKNEINP
jgi:CRISPR system Cascade subunit CasD